MISVIPTYHSRYFVNVNNDILNVILDIFSNVKNKSLNWVKLVNILLLAFYILHVGSIFVFDICVLADNLDTWHFIFLEWGLVDRFSFVLYISSWSWHLKSNPWHLVPPNLNTLIFRLSGTRFWICKNILWYLNWIKASTNFCLQYLKESLLIYKQNHLLISQVTS